MSDNDVTPETRGNQTMEKSDAIRRIEDVEQDLDRMARGDLEANEPNVALILERLTDARANLVRVELRGEFKDQIEAADPGDTIIFDESQRVVENVEKADLEPVYPACDSCGAENSFRIKSGEKVCIECGGDFNDE